MVICVHLLVMVSESYKANEEGKEREGDVGRTGVGLGGWGGGS